MAQSICIDFGSTYTKVALRNDWNSPGTLATFSQFGRTPEAQICVPSIVCESRRGKMSKWYYFNEAADLRPGEGIIVYRNWKSHFSTPQPEPDPDLLTAAGKFFPELRKLCSMHPVLKEFIDAPTRLCVPDFGRLGVWKTWLQTILCSAGWNCKGQFLLTEPEANLIGALTCGRNSVWTPPKTNSTSLQIRMMRMFDGDSGLLGKARDAMLFHRDDKRYSALIIDVGAYTTDCGLISWEDVSSGEFNSQNIQTKSDEIGVRDLDNDLLGALGQDCKNLRDEMSFSEFERMKMALLLGKEYSVVMNGKPRVIGGAEEKDRIGSVVMNFGARIVAVVDAFLKHKAHGRVDTVVLTGGGTLIPGVNEVLKNRFSGAGSHVVELGGQMFLNSKLDQDLSRDDRLARNQLLVRGASAVGGASVYFDTKGGTLEIDQ